MMAWKAYKYVRLNDPLASGKAAKSWTEIAILVELASPFASYVGGKAVGLSLLLFLVNVALASRCFLQGDKMARQCTSVVSRLTDILTVAHNKDITQYMSET